MAFQHHTHRSAIGGGRHDFACPAGRSSTHRASRRPARSLGLRERERERESKRAQDGRASRVRQDSLKTQVDPCVWRARMARTYGPTELDKDRGVGAPDGIAGRKEHEAPARVEHREPVGEVLVSIPKRRKVLEDKGHVCRAQHLFVLWNLQLHCMCVRKGARRGRLSGAEVERSGALSRGGSNHHHQHTKVGLGEDIAGRRG